MKSVEKMRYQPNSTSSKYVILTIIMNVIFLFYALNVLDYNIFLGIKVLANIFLTLYLFLAMEKVKAYSIRYSISLIVIGILAIFREFYVPLKMIKEKTEPKDKIIIMMVLLLFVSVSMIISGVIGYKKAKLLTSYLKEKGNNHDK